VIIATERAEGGKKEPANIILTRYDKQMCALVSDVVQVAMACDLAMYLLNQGSYSNEGDIVILVRQTAPQL